MAVEPAGQSAAPVRRRAPRHPASSRGPNRRVNVTALTPRQRLAQSEALLRMAGRVAQFGGWAVELATGRIFWSDEVCLIHDMPRGHTPRLEEGIAFYAPECRDVIRAAFSACAERGVPYDLELQIISARGRRVHVRTVGQAVRDAKGRIVRVEGAFQDVSRQREAEELRRISEERFRLLSQATNDAIWDWDLTTNHLWWSDGLHTLFGVDDADMNDVEGWVRRIHHDDRARVTRSVYAAIEGDVSNWSEEYRFRCKDGSYTMVQDRGYILRDANGRAVRMIGGMSDISERLQAEETIRQSNRRITQILESITDGFFVLDAGWRFVYLNSRAAELLQRPAAELLGKHVWTEFPEAVGTAFYAQYQQAMREQVAVSFEDHYAPLGIWVQATAYPSPTGLSVYFTDITQRKRAEQTVQRYALRQERLAAFGRLALASVDLEELLYQAATIVCEALDVRFANVLRLADDGYARVVRAGSGWDDEYIGHQVLAPDSRRRNCSGLGAGAPVIVHDLTRDPRSAPSDVLRIHGLVSAVEVPLGDPANPLGWLGAYAREPGRFNQEDALFLQSLAHTLQAALERRQAEERAANLAQFDALTGLPNRLLFRDRLQQLLAQARRSSRQSAVMVLDLDRFSTVNDAFDHATGDALLRLVGQRLQSVLRPGDTLGRLGGDEFGIALAQLRRAEDAGLVAQKVTAAMRRPFEIGDQPTYVTGSLGISLFPDDGDDAEVLMKSANAAMFRAKKGGGNGYQYFVPAMQARSADRLRLETQLRAALERDLLDEQFALHYQPRVSAASGRWTGLEALIRWHHPAHGLLPPGRFIPLLEETGLIVEVGRWVLRRALADYRAWADQGLEPPPIAVNVSLVQLRDAGFVQSVRQARAPAQAPPVPLQLEITESVIMQNIDDMVAKLRELKSTGVQISVDDFGTGYSSLAYLATLPLDVLKIDRSFVAGMNVGEEKAAIVSTIISLAHSLELAVVAEGVEQEAQARRLRELGCDEMQGFLFGKPVPAAEMASLLQHHADRVRARRPHS